MSAIDEFEAGRGHLSKVLAVIREASEAPDDADVQREARKSLVRIGDAIEEQALLVLLAMEKSQALPAERRDKAREAIEVLRELIRVREGEGA